MKDIEYWVYGGIVVAGIALGIGFQSIWVGIGTIVLLGVLLVVLDK